LFVSRHFFRPIVYRNEGPDNFNQSFVPLLFDTQDHHGPLLADSPDERFLIRVPTAADAARLIVRATDLLQNVTSKAAGG
jgi:hypothetical protein